MIGQEGSFPQKIADIAGADFDHVFENFFTRENLSFAAFRESWKEENTSSIHQCCPDKSDRAMFLQLMFQILVARLNCVRSEEIDTPMIPVDTSSSSSSSSSHSPVNFRRNARRNIIGKNISSSDSSGGRKGVLLRKIAGQQVDDNPSQKSVVQRKYRQNFTANIAASSPQSAPGNHLYGVPQCTFPILSNLASSFYREIVWNIAVVYALYCLYSTQNNSDQVNSCHHTKLFMHCAI